jgi:acyl-CoA thioesterase FadM
MRRSSFVLEFRVAEPGGGRVFAEARKVLVHYDYEAARSVPLPADLREKLKAQDPDLREE